MDASADDAGLVADILQTDRNKLGTMGAASPCRVLVKDGVEVAKPAEKEPAR